MNFSVSKHSSVPWLLVALLGVLNAASLSWPAQWIFECGQSMWWLHLLSLAGFYALMTAKAHAKRACRLALVFVTVNLSCIFVWLFTAMHTYGGLAAWMSVIALLGLAAALGTYYALAAMILSRLRGISTLLHALCFSALWTAAELARGSWFTGFGWGAPGYAHVDSPLSGYAQWVGVYGVGAIALWIAATLAKLHRVTRTHIALAAVVLLGGIPLKQLVWTQSSGVISVALLQGNIAQSEKFEESTGVPAALAWYAEKMLTSTAQLTVAPETAIPLLPQELPTGYWPPIEAKSANGRYALMTGIPLGDYKTGYTNSVIALSGATSSEYTYAKHHLVPFGEFIPPFFRWFTQMMNIPLGDFNRGPVGQPSFKFADQRLAPNICYEDLFGEELGVRFIDTALAPTIFVNVSNLGWFGGGQVIDQHLQISRMRALEFERPFARATNTGATVIIDHKAHVVASLPRMTQGVLTGAVEGRTGITPFAWWVSRAGLWPYWLAIGLVLGVACRARAKSA